jgi:hypothetical protein
MLILTTQVRYQVYKNQREGYAGFFEQYEELYYHLAINTTNLSNLQAKNSNQS